MGIESRLASAFDRRDEQPNIELAEDLARSGDKEQVAELTALLTEGKKPQRHDAIKTVYELGERRPELLAAHIGILKGKDNRMLWGAMSGLAALAATCPDEIMAELDLVLDAADRSSVIAKDKLMVILSELNRDERFRAHITPVILNRMRHAAVNQLPMYAELAAPAMANADKPAFREVLEHRLKDLSQPAKRRRIEKVLKGLDG